MRHTTLITKLVAFALGMLVPALSARAQQDAAPATAPAAAQPADSYRAGTIVAAATATVAAVDPPNRLVILQTDDGDMIPIKCGKNVINFDQIKPGDEVKATALDRVAIFVGKDAPADDSAGRVVMRAAQGEKPGLIIVDTAQTTEKVDSVDAAGKTVTLQGADGKPMTLNVAPNVDLSGIQKGDEVTVRATSGIALIVQSPRESGAQPAAAAIGAATRSATVESVDAEKRLVTLRGAEGKTRTVHLGNEVINFDQIKPGDQVRATLLEEVAVSIDRSGTLPRAAEERVVALAPKGAKPGMIIAASKQVTGKIESIDSEQRIVTFAQADGDNARKIKVGPKVDLSTLKAGDEVTARVTEALAIVVEKP